MEQQHVNPIQQISHWASLPGMRGYSRKFILIVAGNTAIAALISALFGKFWINLVISQCIGLSISNIFIFTNYVWAQNTSLKLTVLRYATAIVGGSLFGVAIASVILSNLFPRAITTPNLGALYVPIYLGLFFGVISSYIHFSRKEVEQTLIRLQAEETARIKQEKQLAEAQLKLIQAQIEPHFLFNTLATINSLITTKPESAQFMLHQLDQYLRTSLTRTRDGQMTLRHEIDLLSAYLAIIKIRMGDRLNYRIDSDEASLDIFIPALLLQPIVENAVTHGLEPKLDGGNIAIRCKLNNNRLLIDIHDSGIGEAAEWKHGTGLSNVRERIQTFYRSQGKFTLSCNQFGSSVHYDLPVDQLENPKMT